jgi:hypothetical protein
MPDIGEIIVQIASNLLSRALRAAPEAALGRVVLAIGAVALATAGLAACSGKSTPGAGSSPSASTSASAPASSSAPATSSPAVSASGGLSGPNVCSILTAAQVGSIMGDPVSNTTRSQDGANSACTYALVHSTIEVDLAPNGSAANYAGFSGQVSSGASPAGSAIAVPGLGQQALLSSVGVAVRTGQSAFLVRNVSGQVANQRDVELSRTLISALS